MLKAALALSILLMLAEKKPDVEVPGGFWKPLPPPRTGEWRDVVTEQGQTFREYKESGPVRGTAERKRIYVQPLYTRAPRDDALLERIRAALEGFYGREAAVLAPRPLPRRAYDAKRRQVAVLRLVPGLVAALPADGLFLLAVTDRDLRVGDLPFAFGWGSFRLRVGVCSTARLGEDASSQRWRRRAVSLALHESGHLLSMAHCIFHPCLMNGARSLREADRRPFLLCPVCRAKACWNLGLDPLERYGRLERAYGRAGLPEAARRIRVAADVTRAAKKS